jgi:hypothetical protein
MIQYIILKVLIKYKYIYMAFELVWGPTFVTDPGFICPLSVPLSSYKILVEKADGKTP